MAEYADALLLVWNGSTHMLYEMKVRCNKPVYQVIVRGPSK